MTVMTADEREAEPFNEVLQVYREQRANVKAPDGWRDDLFTPLNAIEQAVKVASQVEPQLNELHAKVQVGQVSIDQARKQRKAIVDEATGQVDSFLDAGRKVLGALPKRIMSRAWSDDMPPNTDWDTVTMEWESVPRDEALQTMNAMVTGALERGDRPTARALMSRRGRALLATRIGKEQTDLAWPELQYHATAALARFGKSTDADPGIAQAQVGTIEKAFAAGANLVDMMLTKGIARYNPN